MGSHGCADRALTRKYWTEGGLAVALDETASHGSGHSLTLGGSGWTQWSAELDVRGRGIARTSLRTCGDGRLGG